MVLSVLSDAIVASIVREYGPVPSIRLDGNGAYGNAVIKKILSL